MLGQGNAKRKTKLSNSQQCSAILSNAHVTQLTLLRRANFAQLGYHRCCSAWLWLTPLLLSLAMANAAAAQQCLNDSAYVTLLSNAYLQC